MKTERCIVTDGGGSYHGFESNHIAVRDSDMTHRWQGKWVKGAGPGTNWFDMEDQAMTEDRHYICIGLGSKFEHAPKGYPVHPIFDGYGEVVAYV